MQAHLLYHDTVLVSRRGASVSKISRSSGMASNIACCMGSFVLQALPFTPIYRPLLMAFSRFCCESVKLCRTPFMAPNWASYASNRGQKVVKCLTHMENNRQPPLQCQLHLVFQSLQLNFLRAVTVKIIKPNLAHCHQLLRPISSKLVEACMV